MRVQLSRRKGWKMPPNTVKVSRPTKWGNPYTLLEFELPLALELYERSITGYWSPGGIPERLIDRAYQLHTEFRKRFRSLEEVRDLRGLNLACWCRIDRACHADTLLKIANAP